MSSYLIFLIAFVVGGVVGHVVNRYFRNKKLKPVHDDTIWCEVRSCEMGDGAAVAKHFCWTEQAYVCEHDLAFCHKYAHIWEDLNNEKDTTPREPKR